MRPIRSIAARSAAALVLTLALSGPATAAVLILIGHIEGKSLEDSAGNQQIEIQSFSWGPRQSTSMAGSWAKVDGLDVRWDAPAAGSADKDMVLKGSTIGQNAGAGRGGANQMSMDDSAGREKLQPGGGGAGAASGLPTGKRQHKPFTFSTPLDRGSILLRASVPGCAVGRAYPQAVLKTATARYELDEVVISGCAADSVSINYAKVRVRAWDPSKKEE